MIINPVLALEIKPEAAEPIYRQIARQMRQLIRDGLLEPGTKLPGMRELAAQLGVSLTTVHAAFDALSAENLITARRGGGTFVSADAAVALGANLRTRAELGGADPRPGVDWSAYTFGSDFILVPPAPPGPPLIRFSIARPDPSLYPFERIKQTVGNMLWTPQELFFERGHPQGYLPLVEHLEKEMALAGAAMAEGENDIILTSGFQRALSVLVRLLVRPGQRVAIETPAYSGIVNLLRAERIEPAAIPLDTEGLSTERLAAELEAGGIGLIVTMPTYHNPTGITMSQPRRLELLELAARHRVPIVEDDWGRHLRYDGPAPPPLKALDRGNNVIHIGTYSKSFLPGLRLGWITCPSQLAVTLVRAKAAADQGDSFFLQALMHEFILKGHYGKHLRSSIPEYRRRRDAMAAQLRAHLPAGCEFDTPAGGFSIWLRLPPPLPSLPLLTLAREAGVEFLPAAYCDPQRRGGPALRLSFAQTSVAEIEQGIPALCRVIADCLADPSRLLRGATSFEDLYR